MTKNEALRMTLDALKDHVGNYKLDAAGCAKQAAAIAAGEEALAEPSDSVEQEPLTDWLVCPKCSYKSPYSPIKARTLAEDAERITKQTRAALAQQEPVMEYDKEELRGTFWDTTKQAKAQPKRQPLTDEHIFQRYYVSTGQMLREQDKRLAMMFARAIEAAHGIKETQ